MRTSTHVTFWVLIFVIWRPPCVDQGARATKTTQPTSRDAPRSERPCDCERNSLIDSHAGDATFAAYCEHAGVPLLKEMRFWGDLYEMKKDALEAVDRCVEINQCVGCTR